MTPFRTTYRRCPAAKKTEIEPNLPEVSFFRPPALPITAGTGFQKNGFCKKGAG
jgi:hypothetical protein